LSAALGIPNRGVNVMNLIVLNKTDCPAILVECCFVDSSDADKYNADKIAKAIAEGILNVSIQNAPKPQVAAKPQQINQNGGFDMKVYKNGSTTEDVFSDYACTNKIGSLDVKEQCSLYGKMTTEQ
jgi:N-acetylmuramoyl-L-alanine amidase